MNMELLNFVLYLLIASGTTLLLGQQLYDNGEVFLGQIFKSATHLIVPVNKLLLVGFYLVNLGMVFVFFTQKDAPVRSLLQLIEFLSTKLGIVYLVLGSMHFFNLLVFKIIEKKLNNRDIFIHKKM